MAKLPPNAPSRVATDEELALFDAEETKRGYKIIPMECGRCGGSGVYTSYHGECYGCGGSGKVRGRLYTPERRAELDRQKERRDERAAEKAEEKRQQEFADSVRTWPRAYEVMALVMDDVYSDEENAQDKWGDFLVSISRQNINSGITERQADSIVRAHGGRVKFMKRVEEERANSVPVPEGRQRVVGEVVSTRVREGQYGLQYKMLVADERGFKVWGTIPKALRNLVYEIEDLKGTVVNFDATLEKSSDDESFGFFSRPSNAAAKENPDTE